MEYYFDRSFKIVSKRRFAKLMRHLFSRFDRFKKEIVGDDFEKSIYSEMMYPGPRAYRPQGIKRQDYQKSGDRGNFFDFKFLDLFPDFEGNHNRQKPEAELCILRLFVKGIFDIFMLSSVVHDTKGKCYKEQNDSSFFFEATIERIVSEKMPNLKIDDEHRSIFSQGLSAGLSGKSDYTEIYEFIFRILHKKKLDFKYDDLFTKMLTSFREKMEHYFYEVEIQKILKSESEELAFPDIDEENYEQLRQELAEELRLEDERKMLKTIAVPAVVEAYYRVYGHLPDNFPTKEQV